MAEAWMIDDTAPPPPPPCTLNLWSYYSNETCLDLELMTSANPKVYNIFHPAKLYP